MKTHRLKTVVASSIFGIAFGLAGCGGGGSNGSPVAPPVTSLTLSSATIAVNGQAVTNGMSIHRSTLPGGNTRFEARLMDGSQSAVGDQATARYERPMGMMNQNGTMRLYDDGTHGDPTPNDGVYCYEDTDGSFGPHMMNAMMGQYHYEFWGTDPGGHESNHMSLEITVTP